jgi:prolyl 4-hydroxylase
MQSSSSSVSISSLVQYAFLAAIVYVLAGAPLSSLLSDSYSGGASVAKNSAASVKKLETVVFPNADLKCAEHTYKGVYVLSREPLVVYIEGFLGKEEAEHVVGVRYVNTIGHMRVC